MVRFAWERFGPDRVASKIGTRFGSLEVDPDQSSTDEVGIDQIRRDVRVLFPPLIPGIDSPVQDLELFFIRHGVRFRKVARR